MSETLRYGKSVSKTFGWFFATLSFVALMSPPGATHDEWYHATSIWCAQGIQLPYCVERGNDSDGDFSARTNLPAVNCQQRSSQPLVCPTSRDIEYRFRTNSDQYPNGFYSFMNLFLGPSVESSFVVMRVVNALSISLILGISMFLMPNRHRIVLFLVILSTFSGTGYFLFASINPSSWTAVGAGIGCLPLHAALTARKEQTWKRVAMSALGIVGLVMAAISRWDAIPFIALALALAMFHGFWSMYPDRRDTILLGLVILTIVGTIALMRFSPRSLFFDLKLLYRYTPGQPDNVVFLSRNLLEGLPNALWALGSVPTMTSIQLPGVSLMGGISVFSFLFLRTFNRRDRLQLFGALLISIVIGLTIAAQVALVDNRDSGMIEARYTFPLLILLGVWWFLTAPEELVNRIRTSLKAVTAVNTAVFALSMFAVLERYVDRQSFGLRVIPDGPDQWWWTFMPFSPNVLVILAPIFLWRFFSGMLGNLQT